MAENTNARTRLLCLVEIMTMYSDEYNILSIDEICEHLCDYGYEVTKRNVLSDIKAINTTPIKIISVSKPKKGFYISRFFSQEAISLILESVFTSDLLTENDVEYIKKYLRICSCESTLNLVFDTMITLNPLPSNRKKLSDALNALRHAIKEKKQASVKISRAIPGDSFSDAKEIETITVNPIVLAVASNTVVLVFTRPKTPQQAEYLHISRIEDATILKKAATEFTGDLNGVVNYSGVTPTKLNYAERKWLLLRFRTEDIDLIENRFHYPVQFRKDEKDGYCIAKVQTVIDYSMVGWLFTQRNKIEILSPEGLKNLLEEKSEIIQ